MTVLKPRTRPVIILLPEVIHEALRSLASEHERSMSAELRWLIRQYVESLDPDSFGDVR
jgi:plasmid stability protein